MRVIGIAGTAKNTGKTTTTVELLKRCFDSGTSVALTSIGYDGENRDNVTGLPKPRLNLPAGVVFATAEACLPACTATYRILKRTDIRTALGRVMIAETTSTGLALIAGPNRRVDMTSLLAELDRLCCPQAALLDGALNRLIPMTVTDGMIIATGGAFETDIPTLVRHTQGMVALYDHEVVTPEGRSNGLIQVFRANGECQEISSSSLLGDAIEAELQAALDGQMRELLIPGACDNRAFSRLVEANPKKFAGSRVVFGSPLHLIASGFASEWAGLFAMMQELGIKIGYLIKNPIFCLTINPFYPAYNQQTGSYFPAYLDKKELLEAMQAAVRQVTVIDVCQPPVPDLLQLCGI